jgi:hypothetical protein
MRFGLLYLTHHNLILFGCRDWSLVHLMTLKVLPLRVVVPGMIQSAHIGLEGGIHKDSINIQKRRLLDQFGDLKEFHVKINPDTRRETKVNNKITKKGYGGWGHPADHEHCLMLFGQEVEKAKKWSIF